MTFSKNKTKGLKLHRVIHLSTHVYLSTKVTYLSYHSLHLLLLLLLQFFFTFWNITLTSFHQAAKGRVFRRPLHSKGRLYISRRLCVCVCGHLNSLLERFVRHAERKISVDEEGDPIWKPSNKNETGGRGGRQRILNWASQAHFLS